jgi:hypothetical protein
MMAPLKVSVPDQRGWSGISASPVHVLWRSADEELLAAVRSAAERGDLEDVLDALSGSGVRRTPDFVAVLEGDPLRVVTRGVAYAVGFGPTGPVEFRAGGRGPWDDDDSPQAVESIELRPGAMVAGAATASPPQQAQPAPPAPGPPPDPAPHPASGSAAAAEPQVVPEPEPDPTPEPEAIPEPAPTPPSTWRAPVLFNRERRQAPADPAPAATPQPPTPAPSEPSTSQAPPPAPAPAAPERASVDADGPADAEVEDLPSYDHLFGATEHVRPQPRMIDPHDTQGLSEAPIGHTHHESAGGYVPKEPDSGGLTLPPPSDTQRPSTPGRAAPPPPPAHPHPSTRESSEDPTRQDPSDPPKTGGTQGRGGGGLIDSVPWRSGGSNFPPPASPPESPRTEQEPPADHVPEAQPGPPVTPPPPAQPHVRPSPPPLRPAPLAPLAPPAAAAPPPVTAGSPTPPAPGPPSPSASVADASDDEEVDAEATVDRSALLAAQGAQPQAGPLVLAVLCPAGHTSPPHAGACRVCERPIPPQQPFQTPRPPLGTLRLSTGDVVTLDRGVLLGRSPKLNADLPAGERPHLVRVPSPENDISRNHVEVVLEGWHVLVRDLGSTNGTTVALPGQPPVRLRPGDSQVVEPGTAVTLADEVTLTYEVASS